MEALFYKSNPWWEEEYVYDGRDREIYLEVLMQYFQNRDIIFLTGLRRVGKTSILKSLISRLINDEQIEAKKIFYISLDLLALADMSIEEILTAYRKLHKLSSKEKIYLFLDEVTAKKEYQQALKNLYSDLSKFVHGSWEELKPIIGEWKIWVAGFHAFDMDLFNKCVEFTNRVMDAVHFIISSYSDEIASKMKNSSKITNTLKEFNCELSLNSLSLHSSQLEKENSIRRSVSSSWKKTKSSP